jgi:hypothetical protein
MSSTRNAVALNALKSIKQYDVASLLEMEQEDLGDALNLGLVHILFLSYCGPFF